MRRHALGLADMRQQFLGDRQPRQLRRAQRGQGLAQRQHVQRIAPVLAAAGAQEFAGVFIASTHQYRIVH
jgi:hypothetical protein